MRVIVAATLVAVSLCAACDRCRDGDSWCTGAGLTHCEYGRPTISFCCAQDGCQDVEVDGIPTAVCSPTSEPDPRCAGADPLDEICVDGVKLRCDSGYGGFAEVCAGACVTPEPGIAFCALAEEPDPRCGEGDWPRCIGGAIVDCLRGYLIADDRCLAPFDTCTYEPDNLGGLRPRCATALPDPACAEDPPARCNGLDVLGCVEGRRTIEHCEHSCYQNPIDSMFPEAFCEGPACSYD